MDDQKRLEEQVVWLIERGQAVNHAPTIWWCGGDRRADIGENEMDNWTEDANKARQFLTREEAGALAENLFGHSTYQIIEHIFLGKREPDLLSQVRSLQGELAKEREEKERLEVEADQFLANWKSASEHHVELESALRAAEARVEKLEAVLVKYGCHIPGCASYECGHATHKTAWKPCDCGYEQALAEKGEK